MVHLHLHRPPALSGGGGGGVSAILGNTFGPRPWNP